MTPERLREIESIFHEARSRAPAERSAWIVERCAGDEGLRHEVESLLRQSGDGPMDAAGSRIGADLFGSPSPRLAPGSAVGTYRIERLLDTGGMGEVYLARDRTLGRDVAIKILPRRFMSDPDRLARFEREARLLASLNHPHIGAIHGLVDADGTRGLVLELIEGPMLADRIRRGALPIAEALRIGLEIAEALEAAHERGIVHRDLKPANIRLTGRGAVKVIDFGLARLTDADVAAADPHGNPTGLSGTRQGIILGTVAYMSPEQARGERVDKRADIWAFGCVLYEMHSGRCAFDAGTVSETIARILEREPDWDALPASVPPTVRRLVERCLRKDPARRLHDIADARIELGDALEPQPRSAGPAARQQPRSARRWLLGIGGAVLVGVIAWLAVRGRSSAPPQPIEFSIHLGDDTPGFGVDVSPDGRRLAIGTSVSGRYHIWMHDFDGSTEGPLRGSEFGVFPFWSPDGSSVGFFSFTTGAVMRTLADGGPATVVCESPPPALGGSWNRDGVIVFSGRGRLMNVSANGGAATPIATPGDDDPRLVRTFPQFLPDGRHFIYKSGWNGWSVGTINVGSLDGTPITHLLDSVQAAYADPGYLLFVQGTALVAQRFDPTRLVRIGDPTLVTEGAAAGFLSGIASFSGAPSGMLALVPSRAGNRGQLTWFDRSGRAVRSIDSTGTEFLNPAVSPSGDRIAVNRQDPQTGHWGIWVIDAERGTGIPVTDSASDAFDPVWSPDGQSLAFTRPTATGSVIVARSLDTAGVEKRLIERAGPPRWLASDWTADGGYLIYLQPVGTATEIFALPLSAGGTPVQITHNGSNSYGARVSPDGKWIAYASNEAGPFEVYVQRFLAPGQKTKISERSGVHPRWTGDGHEVVYWAEPGGVTSVTLEFAGESFRPSPPHPLITTHILSLMDGRPHYDVTRDGQRFLLRQPTGVSGSSVAAIANWTSRLK